MPPHPHHHDHPEPLHYSEPPHHHPGPLHVGGAARPGYTPYPAPAVEDMARFLGAEWAEVLERVLSQAPSEQAGLADLVVFVGLDMQDRLERLTEQVAAIAALLPGVRAPGTTDAGAEAPATDDIRPINDGVQHMEVGVDAP